MTAARKRGFAAMNQDQQRAIASKGGRAAHRKGTAHEFSSEEARKAGYLGGKAVSANREHMAAIGRKGGQRAGRALEAQRNSQAPDRHGTDTDVHIMSQSREDIQHVGESPSVVLPHWRETPAVSPQPPQEEHGKDQAHEQQSSKYELTTSLPEATNESPITPQLLTEE